MGVKNVIEGTSLSPSEARLYNLLIDGRRRTSTEIMSKVMADELSDMNALRVLICSTRKKVKRHGLYIVPDRDEGVLYYRMTRTIASE